MIRVSKSVKFFQITISAERNSWGLNNMSEKTVDIIRAESFVFISAINAKNLMINRQVSLYIGSYSRKISYNEFIRFVWGALLLGNSSHMYLKVSYFLKVHNGSSMYLRTHLK